MAELHFVIGGKEYLYAKYNAFDGEVRVAIGVKISPADFAAKKYNKVVAARLTRLKHLVTQFAANSALANKPVMKADIDNIIRAELNKKTSTKHSGTFKALLDKYYQQVKDGTITNKGKPFSGSVVNLFKTLNSVLDGLPHVVNKNINNITIADIQAVITYFISKDKAQNTIRVYVEYIRQFMKRSHKLGWHSNTLYNDDSFTMPAEDIDTAIYLTTDEILKIYNLKFDRAIEARIRVRDYFVFGCLTGLRFTDIQRANGLTVKDNVLHMNTRKKGNTVMIPLNPVAMEIWGRYGGNFRTYYTHDFNATLKRICKLAGLNEKVLWTGTRGGKKLQIEKYKWDMCTSHTMRRSFATNAYKAGVPAISIMRITGHKTEASFMKYIRLTNEENADLMLQHPHFQ